MILPTPNQIGSCLECKQQPPLLHNPSSLSSVPPLNSGCLRPCHSPYLDYPFPELGLCYLSFIVCDFLHIADRNPGNSQLEMKSPTLKLKFFIYQKNDRG